MLEGVWCITPTIKIPICKFGKKLEIKDIITSVKYHKGSKNNIGDSPDDYVEIEIEEATSL